VKGKAGQLLDTVQFTNQNPCERYGTPGNINWLAMINDRRQHETLEARSSVTARIKKAASSHHPSLDGVSAVLSGSMARLSPSNSKDQSSNTSTLNQQSMTSALITQMTNALSKSLNGASHLASGATQRLARWKGAADAASAGPGCDFNNEIGLEIHAKAADKKANVTSSEARDVVSPKVTAQDVLTASLSKKDQPLRQLARVHGRKLLKVVQAEHGCLIPSCIDFESASVNAFNPLKLGSWVVVVHQRLLHVGIGQLPFIRITHSHLT
jgi:hypothetical protein